MSVARVPQGQTLGSRAWRSGVLSSWPASWRKSLANLQRARASSLSVVWMWKTSMLPAQVQACVAQVLRIFSWACQGVTVLTHRLSLGNPGSQVPGGFSKGLYWLHKVTLGS